MQSHSEYPHILLLIATETIVLLLFHSQYWFVILAGNLSILKFYFEHPPRFLFDFLYCFPILNFLQFCSLLFPFFCLFWVYFVLLLFFVLFLGFCLHLFVVILIIQYFCIVFIIVILGITNACGIFYHFDLI